MKKVIIQKVIDILQRCADNIEKQAHDEAPYLGALNPDLMELVHEARKSIADLKLS